MSIAKLTQLGERNWSQHALGLELQDAEIEEENMFEQAEEKWAKDDPRHISLNVQANVSKNRRAQLEKRLKPFLEWKNYLEAARKLVVEAREKAMKGVKDYKPGSGPGTSKELQGHGFRNRIGDMERLIEEIDNSANLNTVYITDTFGIHAPPMRPGFSRCNLLGCQRICANIQGELDQL